MRQRLELSASDDSSILARPRFSAHEAETHAHGFSSGNNAPGVEPLDSIVGPAVRRPSAWAGPRTAAFLCGCAGVAALASMGLTGVGASVLGVPLGAWLIGAAVGVTHLALRPENALHRTARSLYDAAGQAWSRFCGVPWTTNLPRASTASFEAIQFRTPTMPRLRIADAINSADRLRDAAEAVREASARAAESLRTTINDQIDPALASAKASLIPNRRHTGPLRINVSLGTSQSNLLLAAAAGRAMDEQLAQWESNDPSEEFGIVLDGPGSPRVGVVIFHSEGGELVIEPVRRGRDGGETLDEHDGWNDWSRPLPMGYAEVFPLRLDPRRITLAPVPGVAAISDGTSASLIVALAEAAGELTRNAGRYTTASARARWQVGLMQRQICGGNDAMRSLAAALSDRMNELAHPSRDPACQAAARVLSAWAVSSGSEMSEQELVSIARMTAETLPEDTHAMLRLAAAEYAAGNEEESRRLLVASHNALRTSTSICTVDPLAYIMAELELGSCGPLTVGRVASGVTLLWATSPDESLSYLHDDLLEDLNDAGRFGEKSHEIDVLRDVIAALDAARSGRLPSARLAKAA